MVIRRTSLIVLPLLATVAAFLVISAKVNAGSPNLPPPATLELDMDPTNGNGPCDPVDIARNVNTGEEFQIAVCLSGAAVPPGAFQFSLLYNDDLSQCVPSDCPAEGCLDGNPDANAGTTTWTTSSLGAAWDCNVMSVMPPTCDQDPGSGATHGKAYLACMTIDDYALGVGEGVSVPLAMVTFKSVADGTDNFELSDVEVDDENIEKMVDSTLEVGTILGGTIESGVALSATATPAAGATPGAETTPGVEVATTEPAAATAAAATAVAQGTPIAAINQAATATSVAVATKAASSAKTPTGKATAKPGQTSEESGGSSGPNAFLIAGIVAGCVIVAGGAGWFGYRRFRAR